MTEQKSTTMKDLFPEYYLPTEDGYYRPTKEEFDELWKECKFIFDTNVLFKLYRYSQDTREDFLKVLQEFEDRLWIPHQVALEFQKGRINIIREQNKKLNDLKEILDQVIDKLREGLKKFPSIADQEIIEDTRVKFDSFLEGLKPLEEKQLKVDEHDYIRDKIDQLFNNKIGTPPSKSELDAIYKEGEERYKIKCPPGYEDNLKKKEDPHLFNGLGFKREYGDLILWKQILKQVENAGWKHIIFVTDDSKEDWWIKYSGQTKSPRDELLNEIFRVGVTSFYMYSSDRFLQFAKGYLPQLDIKEESIEQIEEFIELAREQEVEEYKIDMFIDPYAVELMVLDWLNANHSFKEIQSKSKGIDFICTSISPTSSALDYVGYELKVVRGFRLSRSGMESMLMQILTYIQSENLDKAYLIYVTENKPSSQITRVIDSFTFSINKLKIAMPFTTPRIGLIVGTIKNHIDSSSANPYFVELARIEV